MCVNFKKNILKFKEFLTVLRFCKKGIIEGLWGGGGGGGERLLFSQIKLRN